MYTRKSFPIKDMLKWTRFETYIFILISSIPVVLYVFLDLKWLHLPWLPIALIGTAVAFVIGFKNNASYDRLWEARKIWGGIVNNSRTFSVKIRDFINNDYAENKVSNEELKEIQRIFIHRHIAWMTAHRYALRESKPWEVNMKHISNKEYHKFNYIYEWSEPFEKAISPYLNKEELEYINTKSNKATQILALQSKHLSEIKKRGLVWEFSYLELENLVGELYTLQGQNERIKNFPYPRQFATLNLFFVWIFIGFLPFGIMHEFDKIGSELLQELNTVNSSALSFCYKKIAENFVWLTIPFSVIVSWIFYTMEKIGNVSENPFEGTANDIPITSMARGIEIDMREMHDEPKEDIPAPIEMKNNIQM